MPSGNPQQVGGPRPVRHQYIGNLKQYKAIAMDVGDQDGLRGCEACTTSRRYGMQYFPEIYSGLHRCRGRSKL
jgi:hypothetical protein